jgi:hypothetical protein
MTSLQGHRWRLKSSHHKSFELYLWMKIQNRFCSLTPPDVKVVRCASPHIGGSPESTVLKQHKSDDVLIAFANRQPREDAIRENPESLL